MKRSKEDVSYKKYVYERNKLNYLKRKVKHEYYTNKIQEFKNEGKKMWSILNDIIGKHRNKRDCINYINIDGVKTYNKIDIGNAFCKYFSSVGSMLAHKLDKPKHDIKYYLNNRISNSIFLQPTDSNEIENIISNLKNKTSHGHDKITNQYIKLFKYEISAPLVIIFNNDN